MRAISIALAVIGGCALVAAVVIELASGNVAGVAWVLAGPAPFYVAGLVGVFRGPGHRVAVWLLAAGAMDMLGTCLGDAVTDLPVVASASFAWVVVLAGFCASNASVAAGVGLIGLFPTGVPERPGERWALRITAAMAIVLPVLLMVSSPTPPASLFQPELAIASPLFLPAARPVEPVAAALQYSFAAWIILGVIMLYLRYRRSSPADRRRIRWLLAGMGSAVVLFAALTVVSLTAGSGAFATASTFVLWTLAVILTLGSLIVPLSQDGVFGIDRSARRSVVYRALWLLIAVVYVAAAAAIGLIAGQHLPLEAAVLLVAAAALLFQPVQRRLERLADRWVFGDRLDGYEVLTRFGAMLETPPGPADLLPRLAAAIRDGLGLQWAWVRLGFEAAGGSLPMTAAAGLEPGDAPEAALIVPLIHAGTELGRIGCGPR